MEVEITTIEDFTKGVRVYLDTETNRKRTVAVSPEEYRDEFDRFEEARLKNFRQGFLGFLFGEHE